MTKPDNEIPLDQAQVLLSTFKKTYFGSENKSLSMDENLSKVCVEEKVAAFEQGRTILFYKNTYAFWKSKRQKALVIFLNILP